MTRGLNKVQIIGHLGKDPEMRYTPSGKPVTTFSVAVSRTWNSPDGERHNETEWFNIVAWGPLAETCKTFFQKASMFILKDVCKPVVGMIKKVSNTPLLRLLPTK